LIRPEAARWFEILVARDDAFVALEALAMTGTVEIEWRRGTPQQEDAAQVNRLLREYGVLSRRYRSYWPAARLRATTRVAPADALATAIATIDAWSADADPVIARLQDAETEIAQLDTVAQVMERLRGAPIDFSAIGQPGGRVVACVFVYPKGARLSLPSSVLLHPIDIEEETLLLAVGAPETIEPLGQEVAAANGRRAQVPEWLRPSAEENLALIAARRAVRSTDAAAARAELAALDGRHDLPTALGDVARAAWCFDNVGAIEGGEVFSRITGWTSDHDGLRAAIEGADARALASFPKPPRGVHPPLLLRNPWWARPFEIFSRLFGMPGQHGADPSMLLAFAVPLLFGYMFGDVGQGLVLAAAGFWLRKRMPVLRLLIPAGLSAAVFGLLFGSIFSVEHLIHPLWINPLEKPLVVLGVPLAGGVVFLTLGFALSGLGAWWRGEFGEWLATEGGFVLVYFGLLGLFLSLLGLVPGPAAALVAMAGAVVFAVGHARAEGHAIGALKALGELVERGMQILINTLSFARVGAFALAHAGLSSAVVALADAAGGTFGFLVVLALGNVLILALEGLVVSIQTTRLVLFEFFARFYQAEGREFRPLAPPPVALTEK
jgi:V/A-type H+-transporting ATPase subunit I